MNFFKKIIRFFRSKIYPNYKISYSQSGEDLIISLLLKKLRIKNPTYLDIGTNDPIHINNTYLFYTRGCNGTCVEPDPSLIPLIKRWRPRDKCLNMGVTSEKSGQGNLYLMESSRLNTLSIPKTKSPENTKNILKIPIININDLLASLKQTPNLVSLDTEGLDFSILSEWNFDKFKPEVICTETVNHSKDGSKKDSSSIKNLLEKKGYSLYADTYINSIFVKSDF